MTNHYGLAHSDGNVLKFTARNDDVAPLSPTDNPRAQLVTPHLIKPNHVYWEGFSVYVPQSFRLGKVGWTALQTPVYGAPFAGTPPAELTIENRSFVFRRNGYGRHPWQIAWKRPVVKGRWFTFAWHFRMGSHGWIELYVGGRETRLVDGGSRVGRLPMGLIDPTDLRGPWESELQLYYKHNLYKSATVYFRGFKIATTRSGLQQTAA